jgi:hypothetical protein
MALRSLFINICKLICNENCILLKKLSLEFIATFDRTTYILDAALENAFNQEM